jgi:formylglycine-generating enzyme required for sulfatase activity
MMYLGSLIHSGTELEFHFPRSVPAPIRNVITRACRVRPENRYPDARAMHSALNEALYLSRPSPRGARFWSSTLLVSVVLALAVAAAGYWWTNRAAEAPASGIARQPEPPVSQVAREPEPTRTKTAPSEAAAPEVVREAGKPAAPEPPMRAPVVEERLEAMLRRAHRQFSANRLTVPAGDNALESFRAVLAIDPGNPRAEAGVESIRMRELEYAEKAEIDGDLDKAVSFYRKALLAVPGDPEVERRVRMLHERIERGEEERRVAAQREEEEQRLAAQREARRQEMSLVEERTREAARREAERQLALSKASQPEPEPKPAPAGRSPETPAPADMVAVEAGSFLMGPAAGAPATTGAFAIDRTEVTSRAYAGCVAAGACTATRQGRGCNAGQPEREEHPANCASMIHAKAYCEWAGKRIPTGAEWEKAARGPSGQPYPWGDEPPTCDLQVMRSPDCETTSTAPVGSRPAGASPYGALDMAGSVWEWTEDPGARLPVLRGGAWNTGPVSMDHLYPYNGKKGTPSTGFRCVR